MPYLRSVTFHKLANVAPETTLTFGPKGAVLLGKNGTGKTTLLNMIVAVLRGDFEALGTGDCDIGLEIVTGSTTITARLSSSTSQIPRLEPELADTINVSLSRRSPSVPSPIRSVLLRITTEESFAFQAEYLDGKVRYSAPGLAEVARDAGLFAGPFMIWDMIILPLFVDRKAPRDTVRMVVEVIRNTDLARETGRFDESLGTFQAVTGESSSQSIYTSFVQYPDDSNINYFVSPGCGKVTQEALWRTVESLKAGLGPSITTSSCEWLTAFATMCGFSNASLSARQRGSKPIQLAESRRAEVFDYAPFSFNFSKGDVGFSHDALSYGQKRLLSFLWYLDANRTYVVADELVNGMHHDWIEHCMKEMESRQAFLSSQNPLLFDFMTFDSPEDVRGRFVRCELDEEGRFQWTNLSPAESEDFYRAYEAGVQHVGEILRTRGYW